ncbi:MAG: O-antigen ligase family protein [Saprospiraceae bacterium]|nr:O-antigen ligase family protein [Saprospiraceae bacterium]
MLKAIKPIYRYDDKTLFWGFITLTILSAVGSLLLESPAPLLLPMGLLFGLFTFHSPKQLYYLFFFLLPFSVEVSLPGGFGTDLPSEPIMLVLMGITGLLYFRNMHHLDSRLFRHPMTIIVLLHLGWIAFTCLFSVDFVVSLKFWVAKFWYLLPFYFLPFVMLKDEKAYRYLFMFLGLGLYISIAYVMFQHALKGFSFDSINKAVRPIYRNHVSYGIILVCFLPFLWYLINASKVKSLFLKWGPMLILLVAIYLTYTRAAQLAVVLAFGIFWVIRLRLAKLALGGSVALLIAIVTFLSYNNKYLDFAPDYEKTITHYKFDNLVEATYKMQDISTVERFYRWIAGFYMVKEKPVTGWGPSTFYTQYKGHTVTSYKTYVSNNPEKSGIHNNYLMVAVEQGVPGLIIMVLIAILPIIFGERAYHALKDPNERNLVMAAIICFTLIDIVILINDLLEADKVGPFYFLSLSIIVYFYCKSQKAGAKEKIMPQSID